MKRWLAVLLVMLLLTGCAEAAPEGTVQTTAPTNTRETVPQDPGLYDPEHSLTRQTGGAVLAYPLEGKVCGMYPMGEKLLISAVCEEGLRLTLLAGETCVKEAEAILSGIEKDHILWAATGKAACLDVMANRLILLDGRLKETDRIPLPQKATSAAMDSGLSTLYYSAEDKLWAMNTETGVSRLLRQSQDHTFCITALENDALLQCWTTGEDGLRSKELISCQDGQVSYTGTALQSVSVTDDGWLATWSDGPVIQQLYGSSGDVQVFVPAREGNTVLLEDGKILSVGADQVLELYDLHTNHRTAAVALKNIAATACHAASNTGIWFVATDETGMDMLCCWKPELSAAESVQCLYPRYTREKPDKQGLDRCAAYAQAIGEKYGITVSLEAPEALLESYHFVTEYHADAIYAALESIEYALSQFPEEFYERVVRPTEARSFHISLVREITGAGGEAVPDGRGLQVWLKSDAYIVVAVGEDTLSQFYHQLWHMTETYVLNRNSVLDTWDWMNPDGFAYLETYEYDEGQISKAWLSGPDMAFLNPHAMTFAKEDRATVLEYAMLPGNESCFESETMQKKLNSLCWSIRRAFRWVDAETVFPWEQYLHQPPYGSMI